MQIPFRTVFKQTQYITARATFKKGILAKVYPDTATADVTIVGSTQSILKNIPMSSAVDPSDAKIGDRCRIDMFDESNPSDSVIAYIYGRKKSAAYGGSGSGPSEGIGSVLSFFSAWNNEFCNLGRIAGQCVDIAKQYFQDILGLPIFIGNAIDYWTNLPQGFTKIVKTPTNFPQQGDIIIWSKTLGQYGHISICSQADLNSFTSFEQNWPKGSPCHFMRHTYKYVLGWLRKKDGI